MPIGHKLKYLQELPIFYICFKIKNMVRKLGMVLLSLVLCVGVYAQDNEKEELAFSRKKFYASSDFDGAIFSTALKEDLPGGPGRVNTIRFTYLNLGIRLNYDFSDVVGVFSGLSVKNIGFIEKSNVVPDSTIKRRVYSAGVPLGLKVGNLKNKTYFFFGGGVDLPLNYREKGFVKRTDKDKFNEWFSDRVPSYMPFAFAGVTLNGVYLKAQYYPNNFMNPDYTVQPNVGFPYKPYALYDIQLLTFSIGLDIRYSNKFVIVKPDGDLIM